MVTKKKPSAAQIAARKLFAARAKAGTLTKKPKKSRDYARGAEVERSEAALRIAKKVAARKKNPVKKSTSRYVILMGTPGKILALDLAKANAIKIAKHKFEMTGAHMVVENGDTGEVVYDSAPWYKKNPSKPLKDHNAKYPSGYSGKYPGRVKTVYSAGRGVVMVELNDGSRHKVTAEMTDGEMPRVGDTFPTYANNPVKKASFPRAKRGNSFMNYAQCYRVEKAYVDNDWSTVGYFVTKDEAFQYARAYNKANDCKVRVLSPEI